MKKILPLLFLFTALQAKSQTYNFIYDNISRSYIVHLPAGYPADAPYPLVLNMHGYTSNASQQQLYSQMDAVADTGKFIVVYPDGVSNAWNAGYGVNSNIDDVGFLSALIDTLKNKFSIDATRIFACGMSNGGFMSYRLACELNNKIAAIASVTGLMADSVRLLLCQNNCSVPVMDIHGTADPVVNYNGAAGYVSVDSTITWWVQKNGCTQTPVVTNIPDINTTDACTATKYFYGNGNDSSEVVFFKVTNGGHTWPGAVPVTSLGNTDEDFYASGEIWNFFRKHSLKCGTNSVHENFQSSKISVYPNPSSGKFTVENLPPSAELSVYNVVGEKLFCKKIVNGKQEILNLEKLSDGIYFLRVETENRISVSRLVKL